MLFLYKTAVPLFNHSMPTPKGWRHIEDSAAMALACLGSWKSPRLRYGLPKHGDFIHERAVIYLEKAVLDLLELGYPSNGWISKHGDPTCKYGGQISKHVDSNRKPTDLSDLISKHCVWTSESGLNWKTCDTICVDAFVTLPTIHILFLAPLPHFNPENHVILWYARHVLPISYHRHCLHDMSRCRKHRK